MSRDSKIDPRAANPNSDAIRKHFYAKLSRYFNIDGSPRPQYFEPVTCYNCGQSEIESEFVIARFRHVRCARCGMVYVSPRIKADILHDSYNDSDYTETYRLKLIPALEYRRTVIDQRKFAQIAEHFEQPGSVLDIGCGLGDLLSVFQENGWKCLGIEFNQFAAQFARQQFDLDVIARSIFELKPSDHQQFDCVMLWGALEHFTQPDAVLHNIYRLLKPGGRLVLEVPSGDSLLVRYFELHGGEADRIIEGDRHIMLFSSRALTEMTARAGFQLVRLQSNGLDVDTLLRIEREACTPSFVARLQEAVDTAMCGDLLRGFWTK